MNQKDKKQLISLVTGLAQMQMNALEVMEDSFRVVNARISNQATMLGLVVELMRGRFAGDDQDLVKILELIDADASIAKELERQADRYQFQRDQGSAALEGMKAILAAMPDE